jgi:chemotaxis protein CheY-P-specific phosphatase CheC
MNPTTLSKQEEKTAEHLLSVGMASAASAFSMLVNDRVTFQPISFRRADFLSASAGMQEPWMLFTPFIGELLFEGYVLIDRPGAERVAKAMLPAAHAANPAMVRPALLELDNIVSAALATKLADLTGRPVTGDIPRLYVKGVAGTSQLLSERVDRLSGHLACTTRFRLVHTKVSASVVFLFKEDFEPTLLSMISEGREKTWQLALQEARRFMA